jgi:predicted metal-dependent HD superfamily phosphohydrolase
LVVDRAVVTRWLRESWAQSLPHDLDLGERLLTRWTAPERSYHGLQHLTECLRALRQLNSSSPAEALAIWFHDAVHHNHPGTDERASAALAREELSAAGFAESVIVEVERLVLVTIDHAPGTSDASGARVSDADLAILAAEPLRYQESVTQLRAEYPGLSDPQWHQLRRTRVHALLATTPLFHSEIGRSLWTAKASANLLSELHTLGRTGGVAEILTTPNHPGA